MSKDQYLQQQATAIINYYKSGDFKQVIDLDFNQKISRSNHFL